MGQFMRDSDAFSWYMEKDPVLRSTVVSVVWLDHCPDWDLLWSREDRASRLATMFRQRLVEPPGRLAPPRWTDDEGFDLSWHLHRVAVPAPGTDRAVVDLAERAATTAFDPARPLWQFSLVEHLADGRAALIMKIHHSLTDGVGGMQLARLLFDLDAVPTRVYAMPAAPTGERLGAAGLFREAVGRDWARMSGLAGHGLRAAVPSALGAVRHPVRRLGSAVETTRSVARTVAPVTRTLSPLMTERGLGRHLDLVEVQLRDLKRAARAAGGTVNDAFVAAVTGGLRRYHERHGVSVDRLRMTLPINIRGPGDPAGGNRITLIRLPVGVADSDPALRIQEAGRRCRAACEERSLPLTNGIAGALNLLPRGVVGSMLKHVDFLASDVPGFPVPVFLAGARVERYVAFGPTIGAAVNTTLLSYNGACVIGVNVDTAAVPDPQVLTDCIKEGCNEVLALGGRHRRARLPLQDRVPTAA